MFLITEDDLKQTSMLTESSAPSKKEKREAERKKKATGRLNLTLTRTVTSAAKPQDSTDSVSVLNS